MFVSNQELSLCWAASAVSPADCHRIQPKNQTEMAPSCGRGHVFMDFLVFFFPRTFDFQLCSNGWWKSLVYSGYLKWKENGERWKNVRALGPQKLTCQKAKKNAECPTHSTFVFNKFTLSWGNACFGRQLLWPFSIHGFVSPSSDGRSLSLSAKKGSKSRARIKGSISPFCVFTTFANHQLMNDPFVTFDSDWKLSPLLRTSGISATRERL